MDNFTVTLADLCTELRMKPRCARKALREATKDISRHSLLSGRRGNRTPWVWTKGSKDLEEVVAILNANPSQKSSDEQI